MVVGCLQVSVGGMRASRHLAVSSLAFATRNMASGAAVVDQMLTYVWGDLQVCWAIQATRNHRALVSNILYRTLAFEV